MTELTLEKGVPVQVTPSKHNATVQNSMTTSDDKLLVSTDNDTIKKWATIDSGDSIKFDEPLYFMQNSWDVAVFPVIEI